MKKIYNQQGLTLVELAIVIAIIGILAGIALPKLSQATDAAKRAKILADLRTIDVALEMYYAKHKSYPPQLPVNDNHPLVKQGFLAKTPVPPKGPLTPYDKDITYWTEDAPPEKVAGYASGSSFWFNRHELKKYYGW